MKYVKILCLWFSACLVLVGCDAINGFLNYSVQTATIDPSLSGLALTQTVQPAATLGPNDIRTVPANVCPLATLISVRSDDPLSGLIAWKPASDGLALVQPQANQDWYIGNLVLASGKDFSQLTNLTKDIQVTGDLLWSPDGSTAAFVAYRVDDTVYTVMTVGSKGVATDLFPDKTAHTDSFSGPKQILRWEGNDRLLVGVTCGVDCEQAMDVNLSDGSLTKNGDAVRKGGLVPAAVATDSRTTGLKFTLNSPVWSPDGTQVAYLNDNGDPWLLSISTHTQYPLNVNNALVMEIKWSPDGRFLAVRLDGSIDIIQMNCTPP